MPDDSKLVDLSERREWAVRELNITIWPGARRTVSLPSDERGNPPRETEFSVQINRTIEKDGKIRGKLWGPVHRFNEQATLREVFSALRDFENSQP